MPSDRSLLEREMQRVVLRPFTLDDLQRRRERKERNRRMRAGVVAVVVAAAAVGGLVRAFPTARVPAGDPSPEPTSAQGTSPPPAEGEVYSLLDGAVTFSAALPWEPSFAGWDHSPVMTTLLHGSRYEERVAVHVEPRSVESGCNAGPSPADSKALARAIRSDPDLKATEPVEARVGGVEALQIDVVTTPRASVCVVEGLPQVLTETELDHEARMRLYLLDVPGSSTRIVAIAIVASEPRFDAALAAAAPILDSFTFGPKGR